MSARTTRPGGDVVAGVEVKVELEVELEAEVVRTTGGARAVLDHRSGEVMHPGVGPRVESERLYVAPSRLAERLAAHGAGPLVVLDVGLGAGSNALAARRVARSLAPRGRRLEIVSFDRSLAAFELCLRPENAADFGFDDDESASAARALLAAGAHEGAHCAWRLVVGELPATLDALAEASADVVFWDPFSPRADPALWSLGAFRALRRVCRAGATVHTYSGATAVRAAMLLAGFAVGAGGRTDNLRETTIAAVDTADLAAPLDRRWLERLGRSAAPFPADAPPDALDRVAAMPQFAASAPGRPPPARR